MQNVSYRDNLHEMSKSVFLSNTLSVQASFKKGKGGGQYCLGIFGMSFVYLLLQMLFIFNHTQKPCSKQLSRVKKMAQTLDLTAI